MNAPSSTVFPFTQAGSDSSIRTGVKISAHSEPFEGVDVEVSADPYQALEQLYREEGKRLWRAILLYSGDPDVASDAVSEAFAQAIRRGNAVRSPKAWVWRASFRTAAGELKRRGKMAHLPRDPRFELSDDVPAVAAAIRELSPKQRAAVILKYYGGYRADEIAHIIRSSPSAVGVHLTRARKRLRYLLEVRDDES